jgi:hypothetical protein
MLKKLALLLVVLALPYHISRAQAPIPPDCVLPFSLGSSTSTGVFNNTTVGCQTWTVAYQAGNVGGSISSISLAFQSAPGPLVPGTWVTYAGSIVSGSNPATSLTGAVATFSNGTVSIPWVRMSLTISATGSSTVNGVVYGYRNR